MSIELPKDAEGREIPLDTKVLYNDRGVAYEVNRFTFGFDVITHEVEWTAEYYGAGDMVYNLPANSMYLEKPDSLNQLVDDIERAQNACDHGGLYVAACRYSGNITCNGCDCNPEIDKFVGYGTCVGKMLGDIAKRINRLAGDSE